MTYKKKLIEVALPLAKINDESAREKAIRHGHPTTLHLWWARRPLSSARAIIWASLVDDPSSNPEKFESVEAQDQERKRLFGILEKLVPWEAGSNPQIIEEARREIINSCGGVIPTIIDPFGGGGTIALEAGRLGVPAVTGDLNPVAVLIQRAMFDILGRFINRRPISNQARSQSLMTDHFNGLAEDVEQYGKILCDRVKQRVGHLYQGKSNLSFEELPIAWLWVRTLPSPDPSSTARVPLAGSWQVKNRKGKETVWVKAEIDASSNSTRYSIRQGGESDAGTLNRAKGVCLATGTLISNDYIRDQGAKGELGYEVYCRIHDGTRSREYRAPEEEDTALGTVDLQPAWVPEGLMSTHPQYMGCPRYGIDEWKKLFLPRQLMTISAFVEELVDIQEQIKNDALEVGMEEGAPLRNGGDGAVAYSEAVTTYLAFALDRCVDRWNTLSAWDSTTEKTAHLFRMHAFQMTWTFSEVNPFARTAGGWVGQVELIAKVIRNLPNVKVKTSQIDALSNIRSSGTTVLCTDPPYYDNVPYSDLSDFFYVFLRKTLGKIWPDETATISTPKMQELVADQVRHGSKDSAKKFFEKGLGDVLRVAKENAHPDFPATIYYAFKSTDESETGTSSTGWSTFLQGLIDGGWTVIRTWPVRTEMTNGLKTLKNMLASSVVLVCRPRQSSAVLGTRADFISILRNELPAAIALLQQENIAAVDLAQSAIGPGISIFSQFARVIEADGSTMNVSVALSLINEVLNEVLSGVESEFDRETRFALTWYEQYGLAVGPYGEADSLSRAKDTSVEKVVRSGIGVSQAAKFNLLGIDGTESKWDPRADKTLTVWEATHNLIARLGDSEIHAANLYSLLGPGFADQAKQLAYLLYSVAVGKSRDKDAFNYNMLVTAWPEIEKLARQTSSIDSTTETLF